jgi:hypothetical protein
MSYSAKTHHRRARLAGLLLFPLLSVRRRDERLEAEGVCLDRGVGGRARQPGRLLGSGRASRLLGGHRVGPAPSAYLWHWQIDPTRRSCMSLAGLCKRQKDSAKPARQACKGCGVAPRGSHRPPFPPKTASPLGDIPATAWQNLVHTAAFDAVAASGSLPTGMRFGKSKATPPRLKRRRLGRPGKSPQSPGRMALTSSSSSAASSSCVATGRLATSSLIRPSARLNSKLSSVCSCARRTAVMPYTSSCARCSKLNSSFALLKAVNSFW